MEPSTATRMISLSRSTASSTSRRRHRQPTVLAALLLGFAGSVVLLRSSSPRDSALSILRIRRNLSFSSSSSSSSSPSLVATARPYSATSILRTQRQFRGRGRDLLSLLLFDGTTGTFRIFIDGNRAGKPRVKIPAYLLVDVLRAHRPDRFRVGQPNLPILFSGDDYLGLDCASDDDYDYDDEGDIIGGGDAGTSINANACDSSSSFAPILSFASIPQNSTALLGDAIQAMPLPPFLPCISAHHAAQHSGRSQMPSSNCHVLPDLDVVHQSSSWDELKPQIFWRGSDWRWYLFFYFRFQSGAVDVLGETELAQLQSPQDAIAALRAHWDQLAPRWKAVTMSVEAASNANANTDSTDIVNKDDANNVPWIDAKFTTTTNQASQYQPFLDAGAEVVTTERSDDAFHSQFRYHIDLGGGGGTSWRGTLSKLFFPGLLFHHDTFSRDFFYGEMEPYTHYVPVRQDLSDLKEKFDWAQSHPAQAERIAKAGTELALRFGSDEYVQELYHDVFMEQVAGRVVDSYQPQDGETVESMLAVFEAASAPMKEYGECDATECRWQDDTRQKYAPVIADSVE